MKEFRKKNLCKSLALGLLLAGASVQYRGVAFAAELMKEFTLDQMIVTAQRIEKRDVDVPASTIIITSKQIQDAGVKSVAEVLGKQPGIVYVGS
ncbi:hypothetical protein [Phascolarctobacterium succinatutens]|jgi:vitamin B12 transporter|uniref:hypothetical protein n=1 Tax=Phascolarctobacterium succinatutens TaxID=626940 RepID=UPI0026EE4894|nr:hypothetical protein [Phascolarctobacterium succinatutens]